MQSHADTAPAGLSGSCSFEATLLGSGTHSLPGPPLPRGQSQFPGSPVEVLTWLWAAVWGREAGQMSQPRGGGGSKGRAGRASCLARHASSPSLGLSGADPPPSVAPAPLAADKRCNFSGPLPSPWRNRTTSALDDCEPQVKAEVCKAPSPVLDTLFLLNMRYLLLLLSL